MQGVKLRYSVQTETRCQLRHVVWLRQGVQLRQGMWIEWDMWQRCGTRPRHGVRLWHRVQQKTGRCSVQLRATFEPATRCVVNFATQTQCVTDAVCDWMCLFETWCTTKIWSITDTLCKWNAVCNRIPNWDMVFNWNIRCVREAHSVFLRILATNWVVTQPTQTQQLTDAVT